MSHLFTEDEVDALLKGLSGGQYDKDFYTREESENDADKIMSQETVDNLLRPEPVKYDDLDLEWFNGVVKELHQLCHEYETGARELPDSVGCLTKEDIDCLVCAMSRGKKIEEKDEEEDEVICDKNTESLVDRMFNNVTTIANQNVSFFAVGNNPASNFQS